MTLRTIQNSRLVDGSKIDNLPSADLTGQANKVVSVKADETGYEYTVNGAGDMTKATYDPTNVSGDSFDMDNMVQGSTNKFLSAAQLTVVQNTSGTNTGDQVASSFNHDDLSSITGTAGQYNHPTNANMTVLNNTSGTNTGDQSAGDFNHDDLANITGTAGQYNHPTDAQMTVLGNTSGVNTGDQTLPVKATGAEIDTGTDDAKFATAKAIADSKLFLSDETVTLTNKRITPRVSTEVSSATPTINTDNVDAHSITALATDITSMTTNLSGTPTNFQKLIIRIKDDGTARAITRGASFEAKGVALPTTTVLGKVQTNGFIYDTVTSKRGCVASVDEA